MVRYIHRFSFLTDSLAEGRAEIQVAQQRAQPVVDDAFDQVLQFAWLRLEMVMVGSVIDIPQ